MPGPKLGFFFVEDFQAYVKALCSFRYGFKLVVWAEAGGVDYGGKRVLCYVEDFQKEVGLQKGLSSGKGHAVQKLGLVHKVFRQFLRAPIFARQSCSARENEGLRSAALSFRTVTPSAAQRAAL